MLSEYRIIKEIGRGGMAVVYLAHDSKFDAMVALKVLNKDLAHNDNFRKRFLAEARVMFRMSHPNIIKVTDLIDEGETVAFVMEYVDGETLKEHLTRKGRLNENEIKYLFSQMLDAVAYVHKQKLVHRDIKPSNFMLDKDGRIKLMDFGIAKNTDSAVSDYTQTGTSMQMGTPMYMSPEQIKESKSVTAQSDIYSLGVLLWQMAMGRRPYEGNTLSDFELKRKIVEESLLPTHSICDKAIRMATEKGAQQRFDSCESFAEELFGKSKSTRSVSSPMHGEGENNETTIFEMGTKSSSTKRSNQDGKSIFFRRIFFAALILVGAVFVIAIINSNVVSPDSSQDAYRKQNIEPEMVFVEWGTFAMGSLSGNDDERPVHAVTLSPFYIGKYEVTQVQWREVMGSNPSPFVSCDECPVGGVSWDDVQDYIRKLNAETGKQYRLPTEAEWEFAARGGNRSNSYTYSGSNDLQAVAWFNDNAESKTHIVGQKQANELGIYDMSGNVWEWCNDWFGDYGSDLVTNPKGSGNGDYRVLRGGGWYNDAQSCRASFRLRSAPDYRSDCYGFRLVLSSDSPSQ
jgi:formylglycine-generating enzyme required for sulfatase activity/tRNA A-37 threonylcarbamoyl transferase component Bud32